MGGQGSWGGEGGTEAIGQPGLGLRKWFGNLRAGLLLGESLFIQQPCFVDQN